jgi:hypothetical protein
VTASPALKSLLDAIDGTHTDVVIEETKKQDTPFVGEKPLRESIPPVKHAERGPTEKNRDLLKAALLGAMKDTPRPISTPIESKPITAISPAPQQQSSPQSQSATGEISPDALQKILD